MSPEPPKEPDPVSWAAVLGSPVGHSLSPALHEAAYRELGAAVRYRRLETPRSELPGRLADAADPGWRGYSVTMPLKVDAARAVSELTPFARAVGVVNTVAAASRGADGAAQGLLGHNTDVAGIVNALRDLGREDPEPAAPAAVIGGGGTATAAAAALRLMGWKEALVYVRDASRTRELRAAAERLGLRLRMRPLEDCPAELGGIGTAVCTLPARAFDPHARRLSGDLSGLRLLDVSYDPWPSVLAEHAQERGAQVASGAHMLLHQAVDQVKLFLGLPLDRPLPHQQTVLAAMAAAIGLPAPRRRPLPVYALDGLAEAAPPADR
ncbi:shikimate dehydrogenase family protein [Rothia kristinae]